MKETFKKVIISILTFEAKVLLRRKKPMIIAITGSVGKTSTKDAIYTAIKDHVHARKSQKSFNSDIGVALSVLGLDNAWNNPILWLKNILDGAFSAFFAREYPQVLVLEMGVDRPGDMEKLTQWVKPDVVVLTRLPEVPVHVEYFDSPEEVIAEKMQLVHALKEDGVFIYNADDVLIQKAAEGVEQKMFGYSRTGTSHFMIAGDVVRYDKAGKPTGMLSTLTHVDETAALAIEGSLGLHHAYNYAAAAAVAHMLGVSLEESAASLRTHKPTSGRMRLIEGKEGSVIIDDTYNASPVAVEQALQTLAQVASAGKKIAVLGDMLELGRFSSREHERVGELVVGVADILVTIGVRSRKIAQTALEQGMSADMIYQYDDVARAVKELPGIVSGEDVILVKASQSIRGEKVVQALMAHPEHAKELLVRQDEQWIQKK